MAKARADYVCHDCRIVVENHEFEMSIGATRSAPDCPGCDTSMTVRPAANFSVRSDGEHGGRGKENQAFTIHRQVPTKDGLKQVEERVAGLADIRRIERDSEQRYANGEGEPLRFRAFSNDASNKDVGSFGREGSIGGRAYDSGRTPQKKKNLGVTRHGQKKPKVEVARGAGRSALG